MSYGSVKIRRSDGRFIDGFLLDFQSLPIEQELTKEEKEQGKLPYKVIVYGVVEDVEGNFFARQLSEIKRARD